MYMYKGALYIICVEHSFKQISYKFLNLTIIRNTFQQVQDGPFSIPSTAKIVKQCPSGKAEWNRASNVKNCKESQRSLNANVTLVYHCLINEWANATVEVCARRVHVLCKNSYACP